MKKRRFENIEPDKKVWSMRFGQGTVQYANSEKVYVFFWDKYGLEKQTLTFTLDGKLNDRDKTPDLWLKKPVITTKARISNIAMDRFMEGVFYGREIALNIPSLTEEVLKSLKKGKEKQFYDGAMFFLKELAEARKGGSNG